MWLKGQSAGKRKKWHRHKPAMSINYQSSRADISSTEDQFAGSHTTDIPETTDRSGPAAFPRMPQLSEQP